ncbi:hypothetical protein AAGW05_06340 [Arthrobacter sp. LAPM80]|uniref:hypothetical protein n=1 Tax=Arthrobacter sp. LAPM80 TaxID=3141788 RepID=UPI00398B7A43
MSTQGYPTGTQTPEAPESHPPLEHRRVMAGAKPRRTFRGLEMMVVAALVVLIGAGAAVAGANSKDAGQESPATSRAEVLKLGYLGPNPALISFVQSGGDEMNVTPTTNAQTRRLFRDGKIDDAWVAEPWTSRMVLQAGHVESVKWPDGHPDEAGKVINDALTVAIGKPLEGNVIARSMSELKFTSDPLAGTFPTLLDHGVSVGVPKPADLNGLFDRTLLNKVLKTAGGYPVSAAGLGAQ